MKRTLPLLLTLLTCVFGAFAADHVTWSYRVAGDNTATPSLEITAVIDPGFHLYAQDNPEGGGVPLSFNFSLEGCATEGPVKANKAYTKAYDDILMVDEHYYTGTVKFTQKLKPAAANWTAKVEIGGQYCNDAGCYRVNELHSFKGKSPVTDAVKEEAKKLEEEKKEARDSAANAIAEMTDSLQSADGLMEPGVNMSGVNTDNWYENCEAEIKAFEEDPQQQSRSLWYIFIAGFIGGLIALVTPCVWPMIPMTVSFFLKKGKDRKKSIADACIYGLSIIVIYVALGLLITGLFGASSLNALSTSATCNIIFFLLLVVFAISFFGAFDIKLPASWSNKMDATSMGNLWGPAIGMLGFSTALALPFMLFAMFPTMLQAAPRSGGWMNTLKVVLGFIELALSLKFLSVADLAYGWHILDREAFLALWIVIFLLLGLYLLGKFNFSHYGPAAGSVGVGRFFLALASLSFTVYLIPGLWGAPLKGVSAFVPPLFTQDFNLYGHGFKEYDDYEEGMKVAAEAGKPVLIDFSGFGCVNCRKMEGAVLDEANVKAMIEDNFVVIKLMVDEKAKLPEPMVVEEYGKEVTLRTYGDKWSYLQRYKFNANAQPYYVILDNNGSLLSGPFSYDENIPKFSKFLEKGIKEYKK